MKALYYEKENNSIRCTLCPHGCILNNGQKGFCFARMNDNGEMINLNYGKITAIAMDPIEKKPLKRFYPGGKILSVGFFGCNFKCLNCQNHHISMTQANQSELSVDALVHLIVEEDCIGVAFTYNEPLINYEYILDVSKKLKAISHKKVVIVTNGFINPEPLENLLPYIDALNIDLKSFDENFYKTICSGSMHPVLDCIRLANEKCHVEITTLIIPTLNDTVEIIENLAEFISSIDPKIPLHLSAYYPNYKMDLPRTPTETLYKLQDVASNYLIDVFLGNI